MTHLPRIIPLNTFPGFLGRWNRWTNIYSCQMGYQQQADRRRILPKSSSWNSEFNWANLGVTIPTKKRTFLSSVWASCAGNHSLSNFTAAGRPCPQECSSVPGFPVSPPGQKGCPAFYLHPQLSLSCHMGFALYTFLPWPAKAQSGESTVLVDEHFRTNHGKETFHQSHSLQRRHVS